MEKKIVFASTFTLVLQISGIILPAYLTNKQTTWEMI